MYGIHKGLTLSESLAEAFAKDLKSWAKEYGAVYFSYLSYLPSEWSFKANRFPIQDFKASCLIHEPIEIESKEQNKTERGYLTWDGSCMPFLVQNENLETVLYLPALLYLEDHQALDQKIPFLRSFEILDKEMARLFRLCNVEAPEDHSYVEMQLDGYVSNALEAFDPSEKDNAQSYLKFLQEKSYLYEMEVNLETSFCMLKIPREKGPLAFHHMQLLLELLNPSQREFQIRWEWQWLSQDKNNLLHEQSGLAVLILATAILYSLYEYKELYQALMTPFIQHGFAKEPMCSFLAADFGRPLSLLMQNLMQERGDKTVGSDLFHLVETILRHRFSSEKKERVLCEFNGNGFVFHGFSSMHNPGFAMTVIQATVADSLHLILDEISDVVKSSDLSKLAPLFLVLKNRLLEAKSAIQADENTKIEFRPNIFNSFLEPKTSRAFENILSESELRTWQKRYYESYARKMKLHLQKTLDLCKQHILPNILNSSPENIRSFFSPQDIGIFMQHIATLEKILLQSEDLGEEIQSKLFFELGEPAIGSIWQFFFQNNIFFK